MATRLSWWLGGTALACAIVAVGYLPPRGMTSGRTAMGFTSFFREPDQSQARARAGRLEVAWRNIEGQLQGSIYRREAETELQARRARGEQGPLLIVAPDTLREEKVQIIRPALDSAWRQLDLRDPKVNVIVAIPPGQTYTPGGAPQRYSYSSRTYLLPDSTDRTTCILVLPMLWRATNVRRRRTEMESWMRSSLGPCAFYAKFGAPSPRMRRWLAANDFDVAEVSEWSASALRRDDGDMDEEFMGPWRFMSYYNLPFNTVACLGGRLDACRRALQSGDSEQDRPVRRVVSPSYHWRDAESRILRRELFFSHVYRQVGDETFQELWTTTLPIDSALTVALRKPAAEWSYDWQLHGRRPLRLGAAPSLVEAGMALLIAGLALGLVAYVSRWRQVR